MSKSLDIKNLFLQRGTFSIQELNLICTAGEYNVLLGPTGCGKSTLLRGILGILAIQSGNIFLDGSDISNIPVENRRLGYLPQHQYLFPHLNVEENIMFGITNSSNSSSILNELCSLINIDSLRKRQVKNLSGGERQKVALARALASHPEALLLDEPFSAIDEGTRRELWFDLRQIVDAAKIPCLHVTHNLDEAYTLGDKISIMTQGRIVQTGRPSEILDKPISEEIARFLGYNNIFSGRSEVHQYGTVINCGGFRVVVHSKITAKNVRVCIRPQDIKIIHEGKPVRDELIDNLFDAEIQSIFRLPDSAVIKVNLISLPIHQQLEMRLPQNLIEKLKLTAGKKIRIGIWTPAILVYLNGVILAL